MASAKEPHAVRLIARLTGLIIATHHHVQQVDRALVARPRTPAEEQGVPVWQILTLDKELAECRVSQVTAVRSERHLGIACQVHMTDAVCVVVHHNLAYLDVILQRHADARAYRQTVAPAMELGLVRIVEHGFALDGRCHRL